METGSRWWGWVVVFTVFFAPIIIITTVFLQGATVKDVDITEEAVTGFLQTDSRWIVGRDGRRVKLACVNWVSHLEVVVAEGLSKRPVDSISKEIKSMGFNCVRLTWPTLLATNDSLASLSVRSSFQKLGLLESVAGVQTNNPSIIDLSLIQAFQTVVKSLGDNGVMVILDNHLTRPGWCCGNSDGNGFFNDNFFNPDQWILGLTKMATLFKGVTTVVGMSLRNELRGSKQNANDWYKYMVRGAEAVHAANSDVLVILSGLNFDTDLSFIRDRPVSLTFKGKLVFEMHRYGFTDGQAWVDGNPNEVCGKVTDTIKKTCAYLLDQGLPLFVSEFGGDLRGTNVNDNRYLTCILALLAELDLDWAYWSLVGSYYFREGVVGMEEFYGVLSWDWSQVRSISFLNRITALQLPFRGPGITEGDSQKLMFHPLTGLCIISTSQQKTLTLGPCASSDDWEYTSQKTLLVNNTNLCIHAEAQRKPATLSRACSDSNSIWEVISDSNMHFSSKLSDGSNVCLDVDDNNIIVTNTCKCLSKDNKCEPGSQWFKLIDSGRRSISTTSVMSNILDSSNLLWEPLSVM
ncbi:glycosyl hydrolase 5 family protein-like [Vigna unguiculata]|uniref:glycosyl hydrolase 5 family protein-like n=1 Tax=Vigna unguiculata TaxID=3917 RepID=UPI0010169886|nr:glycosyl hydrolase 5 family protein-like [Vigna unguiculata]